MVLASKKGTYAICIVFPVLGLLAIVLRFLVRRARNGPWKIDDYLCIPAWICSTGYFMLFLPGVSGVLWDPETFIELERNNTTSSTKRFYRISFALDIIWIFANAFVKLSIIFFYRRIFIGTGRIFSLISVCFIVFVFLWTTFGLFGEIFSCGRYVDLIVAGTGQGTCNPQSYYINTAYFVSDCLADMLLLVLPLPFISRLNIQRHKKYMLAVVFATGSLSSIFSLNITILSTLYKVTNGSSFYGVSRNDPASMYAITWNWQGLEIGFGLIASNLPVLKPLWGEALWTRLRRGAQAGWPLVTKALPRVLRKDPKECVAPYALANINRRSLVHKLPTLMVGQSLGMNSIVVGREDMRETNEREISWLV